MELPKNIFRFCLPLIILFCQYGFSETFKHILSENERQEELFFWEEIDTPPFDELILCWNAPRTPGGDYAFFVSLRQSGQWSPFLYYGDWGIRGQMMTGESPDQSFAKTGRGIAGSRHGICDGFRIQVKSAGFEKLSKMNTLWVSLSHLASFKPSLTFADGLNLVLLENAPRQSIRMIRLPRYWDMTMIASTLSAVRYLGEKEIDSEEYASNVMDGDFECFDFWPLNVAEAYHRLDGAYHVHVERLPDFSALHTHIASGTPVLVDIQGTPTNGLIWPSYRSHILSVIGYDPKTRKIQCIDPIFPSDKSTYIAYDVDEFIRLWAKRQNIACIFTD